MINYKILIVDKVTKLDCLSEVEIGALTKDHLEKLKKIDLQHKHATHMLKCNLQRHPTIYIDDIMESVNCEYIFLNMRDLTSQFNFDDIDIFVSIGGDGTALFLAKWIKDQPLISINSSPETSVGHICIHKIENSWGMLHYQLNRAIRHLIWNKDKNNPYPFSIFRLQLLINGEFKGVFLNDALFTNENPAEMSVYNFKIDDCEEVQRSSGMWISTAMGSTGGINSAGVTPVDKKEKVLLWKTREPYEGHGRCWYPQGHLDNTDKIKIHLQSMCKGLHFYLDGSHNRIPLDIGQEASIIPYQHPLNLI